MKFEELNLSNDILTNVEFFPTMMCNCGCNEPLSMKMEETQGVDVIASLVFAYYEKTNSPFVVGIYRDMIGMTNIVLINENNNANIYNGGYKEPFELGLMISELVDGGAEFVILGEEDEEGGVVIVSNKQDVIDNYLFK